jgi:hypothetical protein
MKKIPLSDPLNLFEFLSRANPEKTLSIFVFAVLWIGNRRTCHTIEDWKIPGPPDFGMSMKCSIPFYTGHFSANYPKTIRIQYGLVLFN